MMTEIYTLKPGYKLPSRNQATRLTEMCNELIMGEDKMHACMTRYLTKLLILLALLSGLLIFRAVADPRNTAKFPKKREIPRNPPEIFPNTCQQNIFSTYLGF